MQNPKRKSSSKRSKKNSDMQVEEHKEEVEKMVEDTEEVQDIEAQEGAEENGEAAEGGENIEALAALMKSNSESKAKKREKLKKVMDFKFRSLELIQIFLKRTKNPSVFLKYVSPLVTALRDNEKDKAKDALVNKISTILKFYINKQQGFGFTYSKEIEECVAQILFNARKVKSKKIHKVYKYILKCILAIIFKAELKQPVQGLIDRYRDALSDYITKKSVELESDYFKELILKYKTVGVELFETLIQGANLKAFGGAKSDMRREECLNLLLALVQSSSGNAEYLVSKIVQHQKELGDLIINTMENIEQVKTKKFASLQKYYNLYKLILKMLSNIKAQENTDEVLKQKAGALITPYKNRIVKRLKALEEKDIATSNPKFASKLQSMVEEIKSIE